MTRVVLTPDARAASGVETGRMTLDEPAPPRRSLGGRIFTALFVTVGVLATIAALLAAGLNWAFTSGDAPANGARDEFVGFAIGLTGVATATGELGRADMQQPFNVDATVTLDAGCSIDDLERTVGKVSRHIADTDADVQVHPIVVCGDMTVAPSPVAHISDERMSLLKSLLAMPTATGAAVTFPQPGFDRFEDIGNAGVTLAVRVNSRDALVPMARHLLAHPPLDASVPKIVVDASDPDYTGLIDHYAGGVGSRITVTGNTVTRDLLLGAIDAITVHSVRAAATVATTETTLEVEVATAEDARAVNEILATSGADVSRTSVTVTRAT
jgi:hypothetical protein